MNTNTSTTVEATDLMADDTAASTAAKVEYEKGSWQEALAQSTALLDRSTKARNKASALLWDGAKAAIEEWLPGSEQDVAGENLYSEVRDILGTSRKGDASKIKTVALAVKEHGLVLSAHPNLFKAYGEAVRLTKTQQAHADEDSAAEKAIENLTVPKTTGSLDGAAALLLSKGLDGAVVALLDALGANNFDAHRALVRAFSAEIAARVQAAKPKPAPKAPKAPKGKAQPATKGKAAVKTAGTKAKQTKAKPVPVSASKGDPNKKPVVPSAKTKGAPVSAPVEAGTENGAEPVSTPEVPVAKAKAKPVVIKR